MSYMAVTETAPQLKEIKEKSGLFVFENLQRNPPDRRLKLAEIIEEHRRNNHFPKFVDAKNGYLPIS